MLQRIFSAFFFFTRSNFMFMLNFKIQDIFLDSHPLHFCLLSFFLLSKPNLSLKVIFFPKKFFCIKQITNTHYLKTVIIPYHLVLHIGFSLDINVSRQFMIHLFHGLQRKSIVLISLTEKLIYHLFTVQVN